MKISRDIELINIIDVDSCSRVIKRIFEINKYDNKKESKKLNYKRKPINLYINSTGGCVYSGLGLYDVIKNSKTPVITHCIGSAMSMGLIILLAGYKRICYNNSTLMIHEIFSWNIGKLSEQKLHIDETERLQKILENIITNTTKIKAKQLKKNNELKKDWFINSEEALKLKIITDII